MNTKLDGTMAQTYHPPYAIWCWTDETHICVELPSKDKTQPPYIQRWPRTEAGLSKVLAFMKKGFKDFHANGGRVFQPASRKPTRVSRPTTEKEMQDRARAVLRAKGIIL